jgi:hypothetical protein
MSVGVVIILVILVAIVGLGVYIATSQAETPMRIRRLLKMKVDDQGDDTPRQAPRPNPQWGPDADRTNEATEIEKVTGVIRKGEPFTIITADPSFWGARSFEIEGLIVQVAEVETNDVAGSFQFRYCVVEASGASANTIVIEGDAADRSVAYLARALMPDDTVGEMRAGQVIDQLREALRQYRDSGAGEMNITLPPYENATVVSARYQGHLALLEYEPGKGYLPVSAANPEGVRYADMTVQLESKGWQVRLVEVGAYVFLLEMETIKLGDLTVHHLA